MSVVSRITNPGANGSSKRFGRQGRSAFRRCAPPYESGDDPNIAEGIEPEGRRNAKCSDDDAAERGPDRSANVDAHAVGRNGGWQIGLWHQLAHHGLPGGGGHSGTYSHSETE